MTDRDRLVQRVEWALHRVRQSNGYLDTAQQIVEALADLFPGEVEAARKIQELTSELESMRFRRDTAVMQLRAHAARREHNKDWARPL